MIDLAMSADDVGKSRFNGRWVGDITMVGCYVRNSEYTILFGRGELGTVVRLSVWVVLLERFDNGLG